MTAYDAIAIDEQTELYVPRATLEELLEDQRALHGNGAPSGQREHVVNFFSGSTWGLPLSGLGIQPGDEALLKSIKGYSAIAGEAIASRVRGLKMHGVREVRGPDRQMISERLLMHPLADVLKRPNPVFTTGSMLWLTAWHLKFIGQSYWQKFRDERGVTRELWPLLPQNVEVVPDKDEVVGGYNVRDGSGRQIMLARDEVVRFWRPDPLTLYSALGSLGPQAIAFNTAEFLDQHLESHFKNNATPRIAMVPNERAAKSTQDEREDFRKKWRGDYNSRTGRHPGAPAFVPTGFDIQELSAHGGTGELVPISDQRRDQLLAAFGVPGSIVGLVADVNRAAAETNHFVFDRNTIQPLTDLIAEALTNQLAMDWTRESLSVVFEDFVAPDKAHNLKRDETDAKLGIRSPNEIRRDRNDDTPDAEWGEFPPMPLGIGPYTGEEPDFGGAEEAGDIGLPAMEPTDATAAIAASSSSVQQTALNGAQVAALLNIIEQLESGLLSQSQAKAVIGAAFPAFDPATINGLVGRSVASLRAHYGLPAQPQRIELNRAEVDAWQRVDVDARSAHTKTMFNPIRRVLNAQQEDIARRLRAMDENTFRSLASILEDPFLHDLTRDEADDAARILFDPEEWADVFQTQIETVRVRIFESAAGVAFRKIAGGKYSLTARAKTVLAKQGVDLIRNVNASTLRKVAGELRRGITAGEGPLAIAKRIESATAFGTKRAKTIARTELLSAMQGGQLEGFQETGQVEKSIWNISNINTRDDHLDMVSHPPVLLGGMFDVGGSMATNPGDTSLPAEQRINCMCFLTPVRKGATPDAEAVPVAQAASAAAT